jgi:hypothetical protein
MHDWRDEQLDRLFRATRDEPVDTSAQEEHFETRLLARISELRTPPLPWYAIAWRMVPTFALVAAAITICAYVYAPPAPNDMFAAITDEQEEVAGSSILTGE